MVMKITKGDLLKKLITESSEVVQYSNNETSQKLFLTTLDGIDVNWESRKYAHDNTYDLNGVLNIEWGINMKSTPDGLMMVSFINSVSGELTARKWDNGEEELKKFSFNSKEFKIINEIDFSSNNTTCQVKISDILVDLDKKTIRVY